MKCPDPDCDKTLPENASFCGYCGKTIVASELQAQNQKGSSANSLQFDPATGRFEVAREDDPVNPDAVVVDQMARKGFA